MPRGRISRERLGPEGLSAGKASGRQSGGRAHQTEGHVCEGSEAGTAGRVNAGDAGAVRGQPLDRQVSWQVRQ